MIHLFLPLLPIVLLIVYSFKQWERVRSLESLCDGLSKANADQEKKLEELGGDVSKVSQKATDAARAFKTREGGWNTKLNEATRRITKLQNEYDYLHAKYNRDLKAAQDEIQSLRERVGELNSLVETQATELTAAREFTFMTDKVSAADVSRTLQDLNAAIYQAAMQLTTIDPPARPTPSSSTTNGETSYIDARKPSVTAIGERLLHLTQTVGKEDESFPILAFQSAITFVCSSAISSWAFGLDRGSQHDILNIAYEQIWASEKQAVAGRWRALTHKQVSVLGGNQVQHEIYRLLFAILVSIGWDADPSDIHGLLVEELDECINEIAASVAKTSKMIREEFVSDDLQVVFVRSGQRFNPTLMDAEEGHASPGIQAPVLGTVELGLAVRNRTGGQQMLLKPRVALDTHTTA